MFFIEFIVGTLIANVIEWLFHRFVLHGIGRNKKSFWSFHWHDHHKACRRIRETRIAGVMRNLDPSYESFPRSFNSQMKELLALVIGVILVMPVMYLSVPVWLGLAAYAVTYYFMHMKSHLDPAWGKRWMRWHYDHHIGKDQDKNWNVVIPIMDYVMRTRVRYNYDPEERAHERQA